MNSRFQFSFTDVERNLLKKFKQLKPKKLYTLREMDQLIEFIQSNFENKTTVAILCNDTEEKVTYVYDNIEIIPFNKNGGKVSLISEIEKQTLQADEIKDPNKLIFEINKEYESLEDSSKIIKNKEKSFSFKNIFKRKKIENEPIEEENEFDISEDDIIETIEEDEVDISEDDEEELLEETIDTSIDDPLQDEEELLDIDEENELDSTTIYTEKEIIQEQAKNMECDRYIKHETVEFDSYKEYVDFSNDIENLINSMNDKLKTSNLLKFIGVPKNYISNTKLEEYRLNFINQCLENVQFEELRDSYKTEVSSIKTSGLDQLDEAYERAMFINYENEAKESNKEVFSEIETNYEADLIDFKTEQCTISNEKAKTLQSRQELELEKFKKAQQAEFDLFLANEEERIRNLLETRKAELFIKKNKKLKELLDETMYTLKEKYSRYLVEGKRKVKQEITSKINALNTKYWNDTQSYIHEIQENIKINMPIWANEIKEFNLLEEQEHKRKLQEEELSIKREQNVIAKLQAENDLEKQNKLKRDYEMIMIQLEKERSKCELLEMQLNLKDDRERKIHSNKSLLSILSR